MRRFSMFLLPLAACVAAPAFAVPLNLVTNGDFEAGNTGFSSDYTYSPASNTAEAQYTVRSDPFPWNPNFVSMGDHTTGTGLMFVGNGSPTAGEAVWQSGSIAITAGTDYFFEAFVANVCCNPGYTGGNSAPVLTFSVSLDGGPDIVLDTLSIPLIPPGDWIGLSTTFNSGTATSAVLTLINANTEPAGNDFAVDDVFLGTESTVVPEPGALGLLGLGLCAAAIARRRRR